MVRLMINGESESQSEKMAPVSMEVLDSLEEDHAPPHKRHKQQKKVGIGEFVGDASQYNPLDEPSPLGLRLRKSPSLLELVQFKLSQGSMPKFVNHSHGNKESKGSAVSVDKMKASNFPASSIKIGTWEYKSRYEGDLVAKCYFSKHKLVWEVLDGGLKNKIEIQWSDIVALKAKYMDDGPGTLNVVLARQPLFFRETNPQPRKHTLWQATSDFSGGQASIHRQHFLEGPHVLLGKHFEKLVQCDPRLNFLSQQEEITLDSPYFEPKLYILDEQAKNNNEFDLNKQGSPSFFTIRDAASPSGAQSSSSKNDQDALGRHSGSYSRDTPSPCSARDGLTVVNIENGGIEPRKALDKWDQIMVPELRSSMSMSNLVSHLENRILEQGTSNNPDISNKEWQSLQILDDISRCLFADSQSLLDSDEKSLMSRVNSLCCLLQKDTAVCSNIESTSENCPNMSVLQKSSTGSKTFGASSCKSTEEENHATLDESRDISCDNQELRMSKTDSVGDLLLNLPRIASLPQFLFNISEDFVNQAR